MFGTGQHVNGMYISWLNVANNTKSEPGKDMKNYFQRLFIEQKKLKYVENTMIHKCGANKRSLQVKTGEHDNTDKTRY